MVNHPCLGTLLRDFLRAAFLARSCFINHFPSIKRSKVVMLADYCTMFNCTSKWNNSCLLEHAFELFVIMIHCSAENLQEHKLLTFLLCLMWNSCCILNMFASAIERKEINWEMFTLYIQFISFLSITLASYTFYLCNSASITFCKRSQWLRKEIWRLIN